MTAETDFTPRSSAPEVGPPERLTLTFEYEKQPGEIILQTVRVEARGGRTRQVEKAMFQSAEDRSGQIRAVIEQGAAETMRRLAALLAREAQRPARQP